VGSQGPALYRYSHCLSSAVKVESALDIVLRSQLVKVWVQCVRLCYVPCTWKSCGFDLGVSGCPLALDTQTRIQGDSGLRRWAHRSNLARIEIEAMMPFVDD